jgi:hypothetical protein
MSVVVELQNLICLRLDFARCESNGRRGGVWDFLEHLESIVVTMPILGEAGAELRPVFLFRPRGLMIEMSRRELA